MICVLYFHKQAGSEKEKGPKKKGKEAEDDADEYNRQAPLIAPRGKKMGSIAAVSFFRYGFQDQESVIGIVEGSNPRTHPTIEDRIPIQNGLVIPGGDVQNDVRKETIDTVYMWSVKKGSKLNQMIEDGQIYEKIFEGVYISIDRRKSGDVENKYLEEHRVYYDVPNIAMVMDARDYAGGEASFQNNDEAFKRTKERKMKERLTLEGFDGFMENMTKVQFHELASISRAHETSKGVLLTEDEESGILENYEKDDDEEEEAILRIATLRKLERVVRERSSRRLAKIAGYAEAFSVSSLGEEWSSRIEVSNEKKMRCRKMKCTMPLES